jgi:nuclear pore complex protein Nup188
MWSYVPCSGILVVRIFESAYETSLGSEQENTTMLLDDEAIQLKQDSAAVWIVVMLEILELERLADPGLGGLTLVAEDDSLYATSPTALAKLHELILSNQNSQYACLFLVWAFLLSRLTVIKAETGVVSPAFQNFFDSIQPHAQRRFAPGADPIHQVMARSCLDPDVGLLPLMLTLLKSTPLFVSSIAFKTGSSITDPNAVAFRSVFKGNTFLLSRDDRF